MKNNIYTSRDYNEVVFVQKDISCYRAFSYPNDIVPFVFFKQVVALSCLLFITIFSFAQTNTFPASGNVGIGTTNPQSLLHIAGDNFITIGDYSATNATKGILFTGYRDVVGNFFGASIEAVPQWTCCGGYPNSGYAGIKMIGLSFNLHDPDSMDNASGKITPMFINYLGNVLIGKTSQINSNYRLDVAGNVRANKVVVNTTGADFVFDSSYQLSPLKDVAKYIQLNKHLPNIEPAKQIQENGLDIGDNQTILLKKIEELTLYLIKQNKKIEDQNKKTEKLEKENEDMKNQLLKQQKEIEQLKSKQ